MNIGIVGFGKMGMLHGALLNSVEGVNLVAISDTSKLVLKGFKSILPNIKYYNSYEKMIDECNLDAIIITTPTFSHVPIAKYASEKGINFFVEKPLSNSYEDAKLLYELTQEMNIKSVIGFCMRYNPLFKKGKEIIDQQTLGNIMNVEAFVFCSDILSPQKGWRYNPKLSGGGVLIDFAIHMIDLLYHYFGEINSVLGETNKLYSVDVEDEVYVDIDFKNGINAKLHSSWSKPEYRKPYYKMVVKGDKGTLTVTDQELSVSGEGDKQYVYPDLYEGQYIDIGGPLYSAQMLHFLDVIKDNKQTDLGIKSGLYIQNIIDRIYESDREDKKINIRDLI